jgi:predicted alpha/beta-hydrolase family hydrolase
VPPRAGRPGGLLLTPGAGSDKDHHTLLAVEEAVAPLPVARVDFPYRKEGRRAPDRTPKLIESVRADAAAFAAERRFRPARLLLGGRSMGGRICSMAVAEGLPARGLVLISYPLHPPGKPERLRIEHLPTLDVPCLFITGTRDPFGTPEELEAHTAVIPGPVEHVWIEGGRHDLARADDAIAAAVADWIDRLPPPAT